MKLNRKMTRRSALVLILIVSVVLTFSFGGVFGETGDQKADTAESEPAAEKSGSVTGSAQLDGLLGGDTADKEMVYIMQNPDGSEYQRIVSEGGELSYQGYEDEILPVDVEVSYKLDGKKVSGKEAAGKSGRMKIRFRYTRNLDVPVVAITGAVLSKDHFQNVTVKNGRVVDDGTRITCIGYGLPGLAGDLGLREEDGVKIPESFTIEADVTGFEMKNVYTIATSEPFRELDLSDINDMDDLRDELSGMDSKMDRLTDGTGELSSGAGKLSDGADKLADASDELADYTRQVADGTDELDKNVPRLQGGIDDLVSGADQINTGNAGLLTGLKQLYGSAPSASSEGSGTQALAAGTEALAAGTQQLEEGLTETLGEAPSKESRGSGVKALAAGLSRLDDTVSSVSDYIQDLGVTMEDGKAAAEELESQLKTIMTTDTAGTREQLEAQADQLWDAYAAAESDDEKDAIRKKIEAVEQGIGQAEATADLQKKMEPAQETLAKVMNTYDEAGGFDTYAEKAQKAAASIHALAGGASDLESAVENQLLPGAASAKSGASQIKAGVAGVNAALAGEDGQGTSPDCIIGGAAALSKGSGDLYDGVVFLQDSSSALAHGISKLNKGAGKVAAGAGKFAKKENEMAKGAAALAKGAKTLDSEINKAVNRILDKLEDLDAEHLADVMDRARDLKPAAESYDHFGGDRSYDSVMFVYKMDEIK